MIFIKREAFDEIVAKECSRILTNSMQRHMLDFFNNLIRKTVRQFDRQGKIVKKRTSTYMGLDITSVNVSRFAETIINGVLANVDEDITRVVNKKIGDEQFIDGIIERIKRKQL